MKKLLYINLDFNRYKNKAMAEVNAFQKLGIDSEIATIEEENGYNYFKVYKYNNEKINLLKGIQLCESFQIKQGKNDLLTLIKRGIKTLKLNNKFKKELLNYYDNKEYNYCYIRRIGFFVIFLTKMFKVISKKSKIIYEIPTYPLDRYDSMLVNLAQSVESLYFNLFIKKYITKIPVMLQNECKVDNKMVPIFNGINWDNFKDLKEVVPKFNDTLHMVVIANVLPWHGYDRLINSIHEYGGKYKIKLDIYSDFNTEVIKLQELVKEYKLENSICFKGKQPMNVILNEIDKYHIAIGSLGYHRRNGKYDTSIKNKEYCAMGLPIICSTRDLAFPDKFKYIFEVSNDDELFDLSDIIKWYIKITKEDYKKEMREYAKNNLSFEESFKEVFK